MASANSSSTSPTPGSSAAVTGSTVEQQAFARHMAGELFQDIDIMIVEGTVTSEDALIPTSAPGYVQIKFDGVTQRSKPFKEKLNADHIRCVDGLAMKLAYTADETFQSYPLSNVTLTRRTDARSASVDTEVSYEAIDVAQQLHEQLENLPDVTEELRTQYSTICKGIQTCTSDIALAMFNNVHTSDAMAEWNLNSNYFRDALGLTGPVYGYRLPLSQRKRMLAMLEFYEKHKGISNPNYAKDRVKYDQYCTPKKGDLVPSLELTFWPRDVRPFLERIAQRRPQLWHLIRDENLFMHVVPKASAKTPSEHDAIDFRYSFSYIERLIAKHRTEKEQILNGVARSIYYAYLKGKCELPSYFIKTTVLWMCEEFDMNAFGSTKAIAHEWIKVACRLLKEKRCPHYFIENFNLFGADLCSEKSLEDALYILENVVDVERRFDLPILDEQKKLIDEQKKNYLDHISNVKVAGLCDAIDDYQALRNNWPDTQPASSLNPNELAECLFVLNMLRFIDGEHQNNLRRLKQVFLDDEFKRCDREPLWAESISHCSPLEFANSLMAIGFYLKGIAEGITTKQCTSQHDKYGSHDIESMRNVLRDLSDPSNIMHQLISKFAPLFGVSSDQLSSLTQRTVTDSQPFGPLANLIPNAQNPASSEQDASIQQNVTRLLSLLRDGENSNQTLGDLMQNQSLNQRHLDNAQESDDIELQLLNIAILESLNDSRNPQPSDDTELD